jgi:hypothetical protein
MRIDVNAFVGAYPWRRVPGTTPEGLRRAMDRTGIDEAWVSHLPSLFWKDPAEGNAWLYELAAAEPRFRAVPSVQPELEGWRDAVDEARSRGAPAVRADPMRYGIAPAGAAMRALAAACGELSVPLLLSVQLEDLRGRHPLDRADNLPPWAVRQLVRSDARVRLVVTHADRGFVEEVHFGSTPEEASRIWWDISWIWGPPEDHLATLIGTIGIDRFVLGSGQPLRIPETPVARLDLLDLDAADRARIEHANVRDGVLAGARAEV